MNKQLIKSFLRHEGVIVYSFGYYLKGCVFLYGFGMYILPKNNVVTGYLYGPSCNKILLLFFLWLCVYAVYIWFFKDFKEIFKSSGSGINICRVRELMPDHFEYILIEEEANQQWVTVHLENIEKVAVYSRHKQAVKVVIWLKSGMVVPAFNRKFYKYSQEFAFYKSHFSGNHFDELVTYFVNNFTDRRLKKVNSILHYERPFKELFFDLSLTLLIMSVFYLLIVLRKSF